MTKLQKELSNAIRSIGCIATYCESDGKLKVEYNGSEICTVMSGGQIHYKSENELTEEQNEAFEKIEHKVDIIKEYLSAYDTAPQFNIDGIQDYRKLAEFNGVVFGAKDMGEHGFQFSSWFKTYGGTGATMGNYSFDYESAKQNFAVRSGLIDKQRLFTDEQFGNFYRCLAYTEQTNDCLTYDQEKAISNLMAKIENIFPDVKDNPEYQFTQSAGNEMTMN